MRRLEISLPPSIWLTAYNALTQSLYSPDNENGFAGDTAEWRASMEDAINAIADTINIPWHTQTMEEGR